MWLFKEYEYDGSYNLYVVIENGNNVNILVKMLYCLIGYFFLIVIKLILLEDF